MYLLEEFTKLCYILHSINVWKQPLHHNTCLTCILVKAVGATFLRKNMTCQTSIVYSFASTGDRSLACKRKIKPGKNSVFFVKDLLPS